MISARKIARGPSSGASSSRLSAIALLQSSSSWLKRWVGDRGCAGLECRRRCRDAQRLVARHLRRQAREETLPVACSAPADFRQSRGARKRHQVDALIGADVLGPDVGLHADDVRLLGFAQVIGRGIEVVDIFKREKMFAARRLIRPGALTIVEIEVWRRRQNGIVSRFRRRDGPFHAAPGRDRRVRRHAAFEDFVPADELAAMRIEEFLRRAG